MDAFAYDCVKLLKNLKTKNVEPHNFNVRKAGTNDNSVSPMVQSSANFNKDTR